MCPIHHESVDLVVAHDSFLCIMENVCILFFIVAALITEVLFEQFNIVYYSSLFIFLINLLSSLLKLKIPNFLYTSNSLTDMGEVLHHNPKKWAWLAKETGTFTINSKEQVSTHFFSIICIHTN